MIKINDGMVKLEGSHSEIISDIICSLVAYTEYMKEHDLARLGIVDIGKQQVIQFIREIEKGVKEINDSQNSSTN